MKYITNNLIKERPHKNFFNNLNFKIKKMKARPSFTVDIKRGSQTLSFSCSYLPVDSAEKDARKLLHQYFLFSNNFYDI